MRKNLTTKTESDTFEEDKKKFDHAHKYYLHEIGSKKEVLSIMSGEVQFSEEHDWLKEFLPPYNSLVAAYYSAST